MISRRQLLATVLFTLAACSASESGKETIQVGAHRIAFDIPAGWEHLDYGREHHFRHGLARITMADMGPAGFGVEHATYHVLRNLGHGEQRDIASKELITFDGRNALVIDTWDRLSHRSPCRFFVVENDSSLFVMYTGLGEFSELEPAFEAMRASMQFAGDVVEADAGRSLNDFR